MKMRTQGSPILFFILALANVATIIASPQESIGKLIMINIDLYLPHYSVKWSYRNFSYIYLTSKEYADYGPDEYPPDYEYDEIDPCKGGEWGVAEDFLGGKSKHDVFYDSNLTKIVDHPEWKMAKLCCDEHSYIFEDECTVMQWNDF